MKKRISIPICLFAVLALSGCGNKNDTGTRSERTWQVMTVSSSDTEINTDYSATIRGRQDIEIRPQVSGTIAGLLVAEGASVKKGQVLFVIDQVPFLAALREAAANVKSASASLATARLDYKSNQRLFDEKVIGEYELQRSYNRMLGAEAVLAQAEAAETNARNNLSYTEVKSPADGVVGVFPYRQGTLVSPSVAEPLTTVSDNSEMYVYFSMDENSLLTYIREYGSTNDAIGSLADVTLVLSDGTVYEEKGYVESVSGVIDRRTGSVTLRAKFPNPKRLLHSGATGNVRITSVYNDVMVIPQSATIRLQDRILVYKVIDGKAQSALVTVAPVNNGREYIVLNGLNIGDEIVADGAGLVREGMEIKREK
ncbi:efflux RND transporter periplasmic adaptor subunit [Butyricimonas virosa]|uniref:efflux RND transporter periplasmic adaptor subunit n=1 Tax=Butyricimonas virosa TaxID=544645 RepID=UPI003AAF65BE